MTLLSNSPLAAGSPWQARGGNAPSRLGSALGGASPAQSSGVGTPYATGGPARHLPGAGGRQLLYQSAGLSRLGAPALPAPPAALPHRAALRCAKS